MTLFWILSAALLLVAILFVSVPLWRKSTSNDDVLRDTANLGILRDQSSELEVDLRNGLLTQEAYEQGTSELQARLLEEVKIVERPVAKAPRNPAKVLAIVLAVALPLFTVPLYLTIGNSKALLPQQQQSAVGTDMATIKADVNFAPSELRKRHLGRGTIWHRRNLHGDQSRQPIQRGKL